MEIVYLINPTAIKDITNLSDNLSDKYIRSALREAQDIGLNQVLGTRLLERLYTLVSTGDIKNTENAKYKKLLDSHILYYLAYETITNVVVIASVKIDNAGAVTSDAEKTNGLELKDIFKIESYYRQKSDFYKSRLQAYLRMEHDNFPELEYEDAYNTLAEIESAYTSTIFLGGKRGKKPYHHCYCKPAAPAPEPVKYTIKYYVDNVLFHTAKYREGQIIEWVEAPQKEGQRFNAWIYGNSDNWENIPGNMPPHDIDCYAHYLPVEGEQVYYTLRYRVADWCEDGNITFDNMAYIHEPFEWLQCVEREYDPNTREGWAKLTHANLRADTEIRLQKFDGHDCLFMLDLSELNNCYMTDRMFAENNTLREFYPPKGLIGTDGYDFYNCQYLSTINFATADGYQDYQPYSYPMTGAFNNCVSLTEILADNQPHMYSHNGNLYNNSDELMAARYGEVILKDSCTKLKSESLKARGLTTLTIPASVRKIEVYAISENQGLADVYYTGTMQEWANIEKDDVNTIFVDTNVTVIHCSDGDCPVDYAGGSEEPAERKIDVFIEWDYLETRWFKVGDKIELPDPPVREGYTFVSWNSIIPGSDWFDTPEYMPDYDFEVHASYTANIYKLTYKVDGEIVSEENVEYGTGIMAKEEPVKEGHTFSGWSEIPETMPAHDVEINGTFTINSYKLTYTLYDENGNVYLEDYVTYHYGDSVAPYHPDVPEGYSFSWDNEPTVMPAHDVTVTGRLVKNIPDEPSDYSSQYTTFEALTDGVFSFTKRGTGDDIQYSKDNGATWNYLASGENVSVATGDKVMWKSTITPSASSPYGIGRFATSCDFKVYGNIMSLAYGDDFIDKTDLTGKDYVFYELFNKCANLTDASDLLLPATKLSKYCYRSMFCEASALATAPELPATTLANDCYSWMFYDCKSLTAAPELPATTLTKYCYSYMFRGCTKLTTAPELPATTLANNCYSSMFNSCSKLNHITMLATDISASSCLFMWVGAVSSTGTFVKHPDMTTLPTGSSGIPSGWTVENI